MDPVLSQMNEIRIFKEHFNIIFASMSRSFQVVNSLRGFTHLKVLTSSR